ncbi:hypothetical protein [Leucobacter luti]|uniref:DUF4232 domain-containing protein n=1 Tax=Leucobacter luti TaxID=340320 RepID=A0A4V6MDL6_9MICO|nr:hypothetical protein [Leucobacter luti]MBL3700661.1 hypothetical protein [Leucobacter luti]RZT68499.1 hypothetical protein EV139_0224 [Leucobacter luti]
MSTLRDPVGPKDRKVYIRRRLLVLAGLLAVIAVIVLVIVKPGQGGPRDAQQVEVPSDLKSDTEATADEAATDADGVPACAAGQLTVTPVSDKTDYAAGELPQLAMTIENTGADPCSADLGTAGMQFVVSSGDDEVWRSVDCQQDPEALAVILDPGKALATESVAWDRTRSSPETCDITRDPVSADGASYHLRVTAAGVDGSGTAQFILY